MAGGHLQAGNQLPGEPYLWASSINDASIETLKDGIQRASRWADMCHVGRGEHRKRTWELCALPSTLFCAPCPFTIDGEGGGSISPSSELLQQMHHSQGGGHGIL